MRLRWIVALLLVAGSVVAQAQNQAVFRAEANYVEVDAVVVDAAGRFVSGLTANDFQVREQRRLQSIAQFTYVNLPIGSTAASTAPAPVRFRPDLAQEERLDADRIYLIYLNGASRPVVRQRAIEFVRDYMQPRDVAAIWDGEAPGHRLTFTNEKAALLLDLNRPVTGYSRDLSSGERGPVDGQRLRDAIDWLGALQGRRKSLILFTEGWGEAGTDLDRGAVGRGAGDPGNRERQVTDWLQGRRPGLIMSGTWLNPTDITDHADVHIYSYDARGLVATAPASALYTGRGADTLADQIAAPFRQEADSASMLRSIANQTGGRAFVESNDYRLGFARIVEDNSRYYILGYYSPHTKRDGVFRSLDVSVTRQGVTVRARNGYVAR